MKPLVILLLIIALILFLFSCAIADGASFGLSAAFWLAAGAVAFTLASLLDRIDRP